MLGFMAKSRTGMSYDVVRIGDQFSTHHHLLLSLLILI